MAKSVILLSSLTLNFFCISVAFDTSPLQDFCVADRTSTVRVKELPCKDPATVEADDFLFSGLHVPGNTSNPAGLGLKTVSVDQVPGLSTLGLYFGRLDFEPNGYAPPHYHPRATEIVTVLQGSMEIRFVTSYPNYNKNFGKVLNKGDVFVIPVGLIHYVRNARKENTVAIFALNSQNPGYIKVFNSILGTKPPIYSDYLSTAFLLDKKIVEELQSKF